MYMALGRENTAWSMASGIVCGCNFVCIFPCTQSYVGDFRNISPGMDARNEVVLGKGGHDAVS